MKRVCSWCKTDLGSVPSPGRPGDIITHGICDACMVKIMLPFSETLMTFLDGIGAPVLVVAADGTIRGANSQARSLLHKELPDIEGFTGGAVFECAYAGRPEGCGHTVHCNGCTIRTTVMDTLQTGTSHLDTPAYLIRGAAGNTTEIPFRISTEKAGDCVLLRIDQADPTLI